MPCLRVTTMLAEARCSELAEEVGCSMMLNPCITMVGWSMCFFCVWPENAVLCCVVVVWCAGIWCVRKKGGAGKAAGLHPRQIARKVGLRGRGRPPEHAALAAPLGAGFCVPRALGVAAAGGASITDAALRVRPLEAMRAHATQPRHLVQPRERRRGGVRHVHAMSAYQLVHLGLRHGFHRCAARQPRGDHVPRARHTCGQLYPHIGRNQMQHSYRTRRIVIK